MTHEQRRALILKPFIITTIPPQKRWGGVQLVNDEDWMRDSRAWSKRYAQEDAPETPGFRDRSGLARAHCGY